MPNELFQNLEEACPEAALFNCDKHLNCRRKRKNGRSEDYRKNAAHIYLNRNVSVLTAVHLASYDSLSVLNGNSSFGVVHPYYEAYHKYE